MCCATLLGYCRFRVVQMLVNMTGSLGSKVHLGCNRKTRFRNSIRLPNTTLLHWHGDPPWCPPHTQLPCMAMVFTGQFAEKCEDTKGVVRSHNSKDRQQNGQQKKDKRTNKDLQNTTHKTNERAIWTPLKMRGELGWSGRVNISCSTGSSRLITLVTNPVMNP